MGPMMGPPAGGDPRKLNEKLKEPLPKKLSEIPGYLWRVLVSMTGRMRYIFRLVWDAKPWILFLMLFMAVYDGVMPVLAALISANLMNVLASCMLQKTLDGMYAALFLQFGYLIFNSIVKNLYHMLYRISGELITNSIKMKIMTKAKDVDIASFDKPEFYERLENANREAGMRPVQMLQSTFSIISTLISMLSFIVMTVGILPYAPLLIIVVSVPSAVVNFIYRKKNFNYVRRRSVDRRQMSYYSDLMVNKDMVKEVRLFGLSDTFMKGYRNVFDRYFRGIKNLIYSESAWNIVLMLVSTAVNCWLYIRVAAGVIYGSGQIGDFSLYTGALNSIAGGISGLISTTATIYEGTLFIDNLILFMREKKTIVPLDPENPRPIRRHEKHTIELRHVSFRYPGTQRDVLHDINLTLHAGDTCVLVGLNGAGKTTLIKLITRLYDPTEGQVLLDGFDIREYDVDDLYKMFGIIFQDFGKYAFSVGDNIAFGQIERKREQDEIVGAAKQASADQFINRLPRGYETPLMRYFSDDGIELSIGQWQKLAIARAFYSDSDFLILDEPTASLDAIAEQEIFRQFDELRKDKTTIFVSHRLSSATVASKIIVLENGRVVEEGNHRELMKARGRYYELFSTQASRYIATAGEGLFDGSDSEKTTARKDGMELDDSYERPPMPGKRPPMFPPAREGEGDKAALRDLT